MPGGRSSWYLKFVFGGIRYTVDGQNLVTHFNRLMNDGVLIYHPYFRIFAHLKSPFGVGSLPVWCSLSSFEKRNDQNHVWRDGDGTYCKWYFQRCRTIDRTNPNLNVHRSGPVSPVILGLLSRHQSWIENQTLTTGGGGILVFLGPTSHLVMCFGWWQCIYNWNKPTTWRL